MAHHPSLALRLIASSFVALAVAAGCGSSSDTSFGGKGAGGGGIGGSGGSGGDIMSGGTGGATTSSSSSTSSSSTGGGDFCSGTGAAIPMPGGDSCSGDLGYKLFRFAACSCTDIIGGGSFHTEAFNSTAGTTNAAGASIGANGKIVLSGTGDVGGSMYGAGVGVPAGTAPLDVTGMATVGVDAWSGGGFTCMGTCTVEGDSHVVGTISGTTVKGTKVPTTSVPPPCDCSKKLDIPAIVAPFKTSNDNASIGLSEKALEAGGEVTLPCGRYYLTKIGGGATLNLQGRTALYIESDFDVAGQMAINLAPGAEIDVFVAGNFHFGGAADFGSVDAPAKVRFYVGGPTFEFSGSGKLGGNFYAPNATISASGSLNVSGAIFGEALALDGGFNIKYDEAVLSTSGCEEPGGGCETCNDCPAGAPACNGGTCGACATNADCCAPLVCSNGSCVPVIK